MILTGASGDQPLKEALLLIHTMGISSLPVLDAQKNVVGNISHVDAQVGPPLVHPWYSLC